MQDITDINALFVLILIYVIMVIKESHEYSITVLIRK